MPIGILLNASAIVVGSLIGATLGKKIHGSILNALPTVFGMIALTLGVSLAVQVKYFPALTLSLIFGTIIGELLRIDDRVNRLAASLQTSFSKGRADADPKVMAALISMLVLFVFSGTGIFGSMAEGISGDHTIMITKAILDLFTSMIFAVTTGYILMFIAIPQLVFFLSLFALATLIMPLVSVSMMADFKACGGLITMCVGLRILELKSIKVLNLLPALLLVMPISSLWSRFV